MATPYIGEIKIFAFDFPPKGWAICAGQLLPINQNQALFSILGTTYGGDGRVNFGLPDLRGRVPLHFGNPVYGGLMTLGQKAGEEFHTLTVPEIPQHTHTPAGNSGAPTVAPPVGNFWAQANGGYASKATGQMSGNAIAPNGGNQGHENRSPFLTLNICIALVGIFPPRN
ncbi:MAG TPA: tail fiber protein [Pyrinomonadaceae bacterium]|jgi:microcystin-dependent protein